jgi:hypothetical protein
MNIKILSIPLSLPRIPFPLRGGGVKIFNHNKPIAKKYYIAKQKGFFAILERMTSKPNLTLTSRHPVKTQQKSPALQCGDFFASKIKAQPPTRHKPLKASSKSTHKAIPK